MENRNLGPRIKITEETSAGVYSNLVLISHSRSEFVIDYAQVLPGAECPAVRSRIILTPEHTKRLLAALAENVKKYEQSFGEIQLNEAPDMGAFSNVPGEA